MKPEGRNTRIALGILIPTLAIPLSLLSSTISRGDFFNSNIGAGSILLIIFATSLYSLFFTLVPAIVYSILLEDTLNPKANNSLIIVLLSTLVGFLAGAQLYDYGWHKFGAAAGFIGGVLLRAHYCYYQKRSRIDR